MKIDDFDYELPEELIADEPLENRDGSRLVYSDSGNFKVSEFSDIFELLKAGDVLVFNNSKVIQSYFEIKHKNKNLSFNIVNIELKDKEYQEFDVLAKPAKIIDVEDILKISKDFELKVLSKNIETGIIRVRYDGYKDRFLDNLDKYGKTPIPPYIMKKRGVKEEDKKRYQTVYAKQEGSVAAPTAGLHFTEELIQKIKEKRVIIAEVTLHVGGGTFLPVKVDNIKNHKMHSEIYNVSRETSKVINEAKQSGSRIICVGTTSLRTLESASDEKGFLQAKAAATDIFIYPGYKFKIVDCLITNFHLPKSTLIMLVSALIGLDKTKKLYNFAIKEKMRFFSYGDSCFLEKIKCCKK